MTDLVPSHKSESPVLGEALLIVLSSASDDERNAVQAIAKAHATDWWHQLPDVWIVEGKHPPRYWRDLIKPVLAISSAAVFVTRLPSDGGGREWAYSGPRGATSWLTERYTGDKSP